MQFMQQPGAVIGLTTQHHAIAPGQRSDHRPRLTQATIEDHGQAGVALLDGLDHRVAQRRHLAILLGRKPTQYRLARMHDHGRRTRCAHRLDKPHQRRSVSLSVLRDGLACRRARAGDDADAHLHGDGQAHGGDHGRHTIGNPRGLQHHRGC